MREVAARHPKTGEVVQCFTVKLSPSGLLIVFHNDDGEVFKLHRYGWRALVEAVQAEIAARRSRAKLASRLRGWPRPPRARTGRYLQFW